jgi:hypothetical protein
MREAARELSDVTPAELFERFLSWTRDRADLGPPRGGIG